MDDLENGPESHLIKTLLQANSQDLVEFIAQGMVEEDQKDLDLSPDMEQEVMDYGQHPNEIMNQAFAQQHPSNQVFYHQNHQHQHQQQQQQQQLQQQQQQQQLHQLPVEQFGLVDPPHWTTIPDLLQVANNALDFQVDVPPDNPSLKFVNQKLFIKIRSTVAFIASYIPNERNEQMYLRAMILFSDGKDMHLPVKRCANHREGNDQDINNILKSVNPKAVYYGKENGQFFKDRLSIVIPIENSRRDEYGRAVENIGFSFECQNSCSSGINRRPTAIVFTLESELLEICGKKVIEFKVCSCPNRDAEREKHVKQKNGMKRKNASNTEFPQGKRPMKTSLLAENIKTEPEEHDSSDGIEQTDTDSVATTVLPTVTVATALVPDILKYIYDVHAGKLAEDKSAPVKPYKQILSNLQKMRKQFQHPKNETE